MDKIFNSKLISTRWYLCADILVNWVSNAWKYSDSDGRKIIWKCKTILDVP